MTTILLGPQRFHTTAGAAVRSLDTRGRVATVTAGWRDREGDDTELDTVMEGRSLNLRLYARLMDALDTDPVFSAAALAHRDAVDEASGIYSVRLQRALDTVYAVQRRAARPDIADSALADGIRGLRAVDEWYLDVVAQLRLELEAAAPPQDSEVVQRHRGEVAADLGECDVIAVAGGHVGILVRCLRLFDVSVPDDLPLVAWSAGAMAMTERVVLYNDKGPQGLRGAEVWDHGLGRVRGVVALPHARRRLRLDDPDTVRVLVGRFAGSACLLLDDGVSVRLAEDGQLPHGARVLTDHGTVGTVGGLP